MFEPAGAGGVRGGEKKKENLRGVVNLGMGGIVTYRSGKEYLKQERAAKDKHEYFNGEISALAGASLAHNRIEANVIGEMRSLLKDMGCEVLPSDIRVCTPARDAYMYPDAVIVCGKPEMVNRQFDTLKNPMVIFEILSPSTADHDRVKKFYYYRQIPSFREYILIDSLEPFVEMSLRQPDGSWKIDATSEPYRSIHVTSVDAWLPLEEIYRNVF